jgi:universal stress protein E
MQTIRKILVDIDPDKKQQAALTKALNFAKHHPVTIRLLSCLYYPSVVANNILTPKQLEKTQTAIIKMNEGKLKKLIQKYQHDNVTFETEVIWHSPIYQGILTVVDQFKPDLLIKATHQHSTLAKRFFTPTDYYLLKACPVPVLLVKSQQWADNTSIVSAIDPDHALSQQSELDKNVLKAGYSFSSTLKMPLKAVHCFDPNYWDIFIEAIEKSGISTDVIVNTLDNGSLDVLDKLRYQHNEKFAQACSEYVPDSESQHLVSGEMEDVLPKALTRLNAGVLVLGTTYRSGLLGSTAQRLIEIVNCDLLAIKPTNFQAPFI